MFTCSVCGEPGACVCTQIDEVGDPAGQWCHKHCYPKHESSYIDGDAATLRSRSNKVPGRKRASVPGMRSGSYVSSHIERSLTKSRPRIRL